LETKILTIIGNCGSSGMRELNNQNGKKMKKKLEWRGSLSIFII